jgi:molecular chaperone GrpE
MCDEITMGEETAEEGPGPEAESEALGVSESGEGKEAETLEERWMRAAAEADNLRKRKAKEVKVARRQERAYTLRRFLSVLDNLDRALENPPPEAAAWAEGIEAIRRQMLETAAELGAVRVEALGEAFDPRRHEAVAVAPLAEAAEGTVVAVESALYMTQEGEVLRPAKVVVAGKG